VDLAAILADPARTEAVVVVGIAFMRATVAAPSSLACAAPMSLQAFR